MPELPEVESVKRTLAKKLPKGARWTEVKLLRKNLRVPFPKDLEKELLGTEVEGLERRGKFLIFKRSTKDLLSHLGMSGTWRVLKAEEPLKKHDHLVFGFDHGIRFVYNDPRRFGLVDWGGADSPWLKNLGPEPLTKKFNPEYLYALSRGKKLPVKSFLMNAKVVVGVGNIYASEILFYAGVKPHRKTHSLTKLEVSKIVEETKRVLKVAIQSKGSTLKDYKMVNGKSGSFQNSFRVYSKDGKPCQSCGAKIRSQVLSQRSTYWCPKCQK
ncbi:MAG: formamidopyrimidine-DNA glycosylase [Bdellovibrionaceae bacterium]|nr:formamidopyrimidine-DNA glycosylase [Pseudobdellovibrionaceae bacterium]|tara:strand:- start:315 stop:1124 length:810 start_codon:yes stop_codon:yes gene_type:complete